MTTRLIPSRSNTGGGYLTDDEAIPSGDPSSTTGLLGERLQAWKHMCGYLEGYIEEVAKSQKSKAKEQDKILKTLSNPLREGHHFDQAIGGIAGLFENLRANTQAQSNLYTETSQSLTASVLPILQRLHTEIKNKSKELASGAGKGAKAVDAARNTSQVHIESLGQHSGFFDSAGGKVSANNDPYVLRRGVLHRLNKQLLAENSNRQDLIAVQNSFQQFEAHVVTTVQTALNSYQQHMSGQADRQKAMYGDIASTAGNIPLDFEWTGFVRRNPTVLINPNAPSRTMESISFPNQNHRATRPLIEGSLERKSRGGLGAIKGYSTGYYAITPAGYMHEYKDNENFQKDPTPEHSLYLADCTVGPVEDTKFVIKGKSSSGSKIGQKMSVTSDYSFKAHTASDAQQWHAIIAERCSGTTVSSPVSPAESRNITPVNTNIPVPEQQQGIVEKGPQSAGAQVTPQSATGKGPSAGFDKTNAATSGTTPIKETTVTPAGQGTHFHRAPASNALEDRKYVEQ